MRPWIACMLLLTGTMLFAEELPVLKGKNLFGVYLGEPVEAVVERATEMKLHVAKTKYSDVALTINGALNGSKTVRRLVVYHVMSRVQAVVVHFDNPTQELFSSMADSLLLKYKGDMVAPGLYTFTAVIDGQNVSIELGNTPEPGGDDPDVHIRYTYDALQEKAILESRKANAARIKDDL